MVVVEVINNSEQILTDVIVKVGKIGIWMETVGVIVVLWIIFQAVTLFFNRKRRLALYEIKDKVNILEKKIDRLSREIKSKR